MWITSVARRISFAAVIIALGTGCASNGHHESQEKWQSGAPAPAVADKDQVFTKFTKSTPVSMDMALLKGDKVAGPRQKITVICKNLKLEPWFNRASFSVNLPNFENPCWPNVSIDIPYDRIIDLEIVGECGWHDYVWYVTLDI